MVLEYEKKYELIQYPIDKKSYVHLDKDGVV